ncbi:MAG: hypothetical protein JSU00_01715 [Acidobacteria bacterium]|nr:hypothetical protein [Acidobacteriota bacterium]
MDLRYRVTLAASLAAIACLPSFAAPKLRLQNTALGPISVATGSNGADQTVNAINAGDSALNLSVSSSVSWLTPSVASLTSCGVIGRCNPITIKLNTTSLAKGSYTGIVTVSDANAIDAPQNITVTVAVGGGVPDAITMYVPVGGSAAPQTFFTGGRASTTVTAPSSGPALTVDPPALSLPGGGSFEGTYTYTVKSSAVAGTAEKAYTGSISVTGSPVALENRTVPVTINVTSQPIAVLSSSSLSYRIAQSAAKQVQNIVIANQGSGTITVSKADVATTTGGSWLTATLGSYYVTMTADPTGLAPGDYQGSVTITTNAANATATVPVSLTVIATGPPLAIAGGVVNNATFSNDPIAQGDFPAVFGEQFTTGALALASNVPYPTTSGGATVYLNGNPVPIYFVSANQINFLVPFDAAVGDGTLRVDRDGQRGNSVTVTIKARSPKLLVATNQAGQQVAYALRTAGLAPVKRGDYITLYGFGFGQTIPASAVNTASSTSSLVNVPGTNTAYFGKSQFPITAVGVTPQFLGLAPGFVTSFYQINVQVPSNSPTGTAVPVYILGDAGNTNELLLNIQ